MELTARQKKTKEILQKVFFKAWEDENFKKELIIDPIEAIKKLTGENIHLPPGKTLVVEDQTNESNIYLNIPAEPKMEDFELSESQLEAIAGGKDFWSMSILPNLPINTYKEEE